MWAEQAAAVLSLLFLLFSWISTFNSAKSITLGAGDGKWSWTLNSLFNIPTAKGASYELKYFVSSWGAVYYQDKSLSKSLFQAEIRVSAGLSGSATAHVQYVFLYVCPKPFGPMCVPPRHHTQNSRHSCRKKLQHSGNVQQSVHGIWWPNDWDQVGHQSPRRGSRDTMYTMQG